MSKPICWGLLSTAKINNAVIRPIQESSNHQLAAVASRNLDKAKAYAAEKNIPRAYGSYEELLADPEVDVIYNSLPNHLHAEWTIKACQAGKHVLCEKPIALSLEEVDAIEEASRKAGVVVQEAFMYRHHPQTLRVKEMVDQGAIGPVHLIRGIFTFYNENPQNVRLVPEYGGGSIWDVGVYPVSYMRTVLNSMPEEVFCWQISGPTGVDVAFSGELRFPSGILGQFQSGFIAHRYTSVEIMGEKGSLFIPNPFSPYTNEEFNWITEKEPQWIRIPGMNLYLGELDDLAECIRTGKSPRVTLEDSRKNTQVILACIESARTGKSVFL